VRTRWAETYKGAKDASVPMASASSAPPKKVVRRFADCIIGLFHLLDYRTEGRLSVHQSHRWTLNILLTQSKAIYLPMQSVKLTSMLLVEFCSIGSPG
jgi:hypothetical protein